jgi:uncharacterized RDD family membrane protein YckC
MTYSEGQQPPGWYYAHGDPPATQRYWDGTSWVGAPQPVPGSEVAASTLKSALPLPRIGARIIDWLLWAVVLTVVSVALDGLGAGGSVTGPAVRALTTALVLVYETVMVMQAGATLGKMTIGLKVVDRTGGNITSAAAIRRSLLLAVVGLVWIAGGWTLWMEALAWPVIIAAVAAGFVMLFTGRERQTPWDRVADTVVVSK